MRALFILLFTSLAAEAATIYCGPSNTGSGSGADFNNLLQLPDTTGFTRGNTYVIVEGSYGSRFFSEVASGSTLVSIRKASTADSAVAGYATTLFDSQAVFTDMEWSTSYWDVDGVTGGGPSSWTSGHGIAVRNLASHLIASVASVAFISLHHVELDGTDNTNADRDAIYFIGGATDIMMEYMYVHDIGCDFAQIRSTNTRWTNQYCHFFNNNQGVTCHGDVYEYDGDIFSASVFRWNWYDACEGTYLWGSHESGEFNSCEIYGNIVSGGQMANGLVAALSGGGEINGLRFYNNTIFGIGANNAGFLDLRGTDNIIENNIWYGNASLSMEGTHDYNAADEDLSESNDQLLGGDPFTNSGSDDFSLVGATTAGNTLSSPYNVDMNGVTRGSDGTWDRGALEFNGAPPPDLPFIPGTPKLRGIRLAR